MMLGAGGMTITPAIAQNPNYAPGGLVLGLQNPGGTTGSDQTVIFNLGDTAVDFRDATTDRINFANIGATLTSTFGANWWESRTLYIGMAGVWGTSPLGTGLQNGDPHRTVYISRPRESLGTPGSPASTPWQILGDTDMTNAAGRITQMTNVLEANYSTALAVSSTTQSQLDDQNPFIQAEVQGTAYGVFPGGVQDQFEPGSLGNLGGVFAEAALDLYRIQARNNITGQEGFGEPARIGEYEGTLLIDQFGNLSFIVIPEPSIVTLFGIGAMLVASRGRRPKIRAHSAS